MTEAVSSSLLAGTSTAQSVLRYHLLRVEERADLLTIFLDEA
jgi:hypothetical protein